MSNSTPPEGRGPEDMTREEYQSALFANMVIQQTNLAMMMMGKAPHPETGQVMHDLDTARMFIDQLEMLEAKTKGNLSPQEERLLKQALPAVQMAFVEAANAGGGGHIEAAPERPVPEPIAPAPEAKPTPAAPAPESPAAAADESRKKFSKKY
jgi:hypothetical protein